MGMGRDTLHETLCSDFESGTIDKIAAVNDA
jgi:hypothetical protein